MARVEQTVSNGEPVRSEQSHPVTLAPGKSGHCLFTPGHDFAALKLIPPSRDVFLDQADPDGFAVQRDAGTHFRENGCAWGHGTDTRQARPRQVERSLTGG